MLYSSSCEYAIRALIYLEQQSRDRLTPLADIAEAQDLPAPFLGKILQSLVRKRLLRSVRGPTGGYAIVQSPAEITLFLLRDILDGTADLDQCAVGLNPCEDDTPCPLHESFKPLRAAIRSYLEETSIADVAEGLRKKRAAIAAR